MNSEGADKKCVQLDPHVCFLPTKKFLTFLLFFILYPRLKVATETDLVGLSQVRNPKTVNSLEDSFPTAS